jgi:hypothetical protein
MRPFTLSNVAALAAGQLLGILSACASTYGVWLWLAALILSGDQAAFTRA